MREAWERRCSSLGDEERRQFESYACNGLAEYTTRLAAACQKHRDESKIFRVFDWFEPLLKAVDLFVPAAAVAIQAYPNPSSLVLGGIVATLQTTSRLLNYQKLAIQMLSKMGKKTVVFMEYEKEIYKDDYLVQRALVEVYGDIIDFCRKAVRQVNEKGKLQIKVKGVVLSIFRDFESHLGEEVKRFENDVEDLEYKALLCGRRRLLELQQGQEAHRKESNEASGAHSRRLNDIRELQVKLWERHVSLHQRS